MIFGKRKAPRKPRRTYQPLTNVEDAARWRDLMAYFDYWPESPYTDIEHRALADQVRIIRDRESSINERAGGLSEKLIKAFLPSPIIHAALQWYAAELQGLSPDASISEILDTLKPEGER